MDLAHSARAVLEGAGYRVTAAAEEEIFYFEDESLFGLVWVTNSAEAIISGWEKKQDTFLIKQAERMRHSARKSWNAYCVCLSAGVSAAKEKHQLSEIEEDFRGARKIARADLNTTEDVRRALLPLIAIQSVVQLESVDAIGRLRAKLSELPADCVLGLLSDGPLEELRQLLIQTNANSRNNN